MKLEHCVIEDDVLAEHPLHLYHTPLTSTWGERFSLRSGTYGTSILWLNGSAKILEHPEGKVAILSKSELSRRQNFIDTRTRWRRYIDPVRIVDATKNVNVEDIRKAILGVCEVPSCNKTALFEYGDPILACSQDHMKQLGYKGKKRVPLHLFTIEDPVTIYLK